MIDTNQTIVAIASPFVPARRGVVRLSGSGVMRVVERMCPATGLQSHSRWPRRHDTRVDLGEPICDVEAALMVWPTSRSYTGQPSVEFHLIGSLPILQAVVDLSIHHGARAAREGEFTMRAFLAGRLDLTQAEAVLGVIDAQDRGSLDHSLRQLAGNLSTPLEAMRSDLLDLLADVEAGLDFVDEDIEFVTDRQLADRLESIKSKLEQIGSLITAREDQRQMTTVALLGRPNVGKSRLLNGLVDRQAALVADLAGTTRDQVTADAMILGHRVKFVDTAGIEVNNDGSDGNPTVAGMAQQQTCQAAGDADIRIWCVEATDQTSVEGVSSGIGPSRRASSHDIHVVTKVDLLPGEIDKKPAVIATSSLTGQGIGELRDVIARLINQRDTGQSGSVVGTAARCKSSLLQASVAIEQAIRLVQCGDGHEFIATEIRSAVEQIGEVTGAVYTDDILDRVFGRFCIGK